MSVNPSPDTPRANAGTETVRLETAHLRSRDSVKEDRCSVKAALADHSVRRTENKELSSTQGSVSHRTQALRLNL